MVKIFIGVIAVAFIVIIGFMVVDPAIPSNGDIGAISETAGNITGKYSIEGEVIKSGTYTLKDGVTASNKSSVVVGTVETIVDITDESGDCDVLYEFGDVDGQVDTNPETGVSFPLLVVATGAILAGGAYVFTRKQTKLHKI